MSVMIETQILKGNPVSERIRKSLCVRINKLATVNIIPGLAAILVGDDPASQVYVRNKSRAFKKLNCHSETFNLPSNTSENTLLELINQINNDTKFHGILVQLPLPRHIDSRRVLLSIPSEKDVDGFHPYNLGLLLEGNPQFIPCTPNGIIEILKYYNIPVSGKHVVIIGRSNIVGKPMFALLSQKFEKGNATVTICHTKTHDISYFTRQADIIIAAAGIPHLVTSNMIKENVVIIDVGINRVEDNSKNGYHLTGDVDYEDVIEKASAITPVPGGVGPMTITMLINNTVSAAEQSI